MNSNVPEDGLDQLLQGTWGNLAQRIDMLHRSLDADAQHALNAMHARRERDERAKTETLRRMEIERNRLLSWELQHRRELNQGFEQVVDTMLARPDAIPTLSDQSLLKAWTVTDMLTGTDPGYAPRNTKAREMLANAWQARHPGEDITMAAQRAIGRVTVTYTAQAPGLDDTLAAFAKAGIPVRERRLEGQDAADFTAVHGDTFNVQPDYGDGWDGYDPERITGTVMQTAVLSPGQAADQIAYLRDQGLPESSGSDNRSTGDEPSSLFEGSTNELEDAAPSNTDNANQPTKVEKAAEAVGMDDSGDLSTGSGAVELTDCDETRDDDPLAVGGIDEQLRNSGHQPQEQHAETVVDSRIFDSSETVLGFSK